MSALANLAALEGTQIAPGVRRAAITGPEAAHLRAWSLRIASGAQWADRVPDGADLYLFALAGSATVQAAGEPAPFPEEAFVAIAEGTQFRLRNSGAGEAVFVQVVAHAQAGGVSLPGYSGGVRVLPMREAPRIEDTVQNKSRIGFVQ